MKIKLRDDLTGSGIDQRGRHSVRENPIIIPAALINLMRRRTFQLPAEDTADRYKP